MIPSAFMLLEAMPLTSNGKVDRRALPEAEQLRPELRVDYVAPRTRVEEALVRIWAEVIGLAHVGIHDNFFELGGHSIAAFQIMFQVIKEFELEVPLQSLFQSPTVAEMAVVITECRGKKLDEKEMSRILTELESLTDEEAQRLIGEGVSKDPNCGK
jgi:acyl carrier protein